MKKTEKLFGLKNSNGDIINYFAVPFANIKKLYGSAGGLEIVINARHKNHYVAVYHFPSKVLKSDEHLRALLFGREFTDGHFIGNETTANELNELYAENYCVNMVKLEELEKLNDNKGIGAEFVNGYKHASEKQDKRLKIDVIDHEGHFWQTKTSVASEQTNWSYAITNGSVWD